MEFKSREEISKGISSNDNYQESLLKSLQESLQGVDSTKWKDEPDTKVVQVEAQEEYFWIRINLKEEDTLLEVGDVLHIKYVPTNEVLEMSFGSYEKEGLNRDHDDEVINYVNEDDRKILCCMIDLNRVNKRSEDIPTIRTFFRNSRYYEENLFYKDDIKIVCESKDIDFEYTSISF